MKNRIIKDRFILEEERIRRMNYLLLVPIFMCSFAVKGLGLWGIVYGIHLIRQPQLWKKYVRFFLLWVGWSNRNRCWYLVSYIYYLLDKKSSP